MEVIKAYGILLYKIEKNCTKILLCKSVKSLDKWGCLKGMQTGKESAKECAKREFKEECGIIVETYLFEDYFYQENKEKNIGIWIINAKKIDNLDKYFIDDKLYDNYLSWENSKVKFFDIKDLPDIKKKQKILVKEIKDFLQSKSQSH
ncbi:MAG: NUDIX hydrolase [Arcobacter sp.]|nr:MAG: NUDIX hydrolase [Arcobacter sp.]